MDTLRLLLSVIVCLAMIGFLGAQATKTNKPGGQSPRSAASQPAAAKASGQKPPAAASEEDTRQSEPTADAQEADRAGILSCATAYLAAYNMGDVSAAANCLAADVEYVDESGDVLQGREKIQEILAELFAEHPGRQLDLNIESIRFVGPGVAIADGHSTLVDVEGAVLSYHRYSAIYVKADEEWLMASVRDRPPKNRREHRVHLEQLNWLLGDWVDESPDAVVMFSCVPSEDGNFLIRTFTEQQAGEPLFHGTQWIGWDPLNHQLRSWTFDSEGGFSTGVWYHDDENWLLKSTGVTADGEAASGTTVFSFVNGHQLNWQVVDVEVGGIAAPNGDVISIVTRPPSPDFTIPVLDLDGKTDNSPPEKPEK